MSKSKKRLFQVLDEMNLEDTEKNSKLVAVSPNFISADKVKGGAKISMGAEEQFITSIANDEYIPLLILVDKKEYFKRKDL